MFVDDVVGQGDDGGTTPSMRWMQSTGVAAAAAAAAAAALLQCCNALSTDVRACVRACSYFVQGLGEGLPGAE